MAPFLELLAQDLAAHPERVQALDVAVVRVRRQIRRTDHGNGWCLHPTPSPMSQYRVRNVLVEHRH